MASCRILIVGGGLAGLSTAWYLADRGVRDVVLVEREPGLARHSSRRSAAILRTSSPDPTIESLARRSASFLRTPPRGFSGTPLLDACGFLVETGPREGTPAPWERRALESGDAETIPEDRLASIAPHFAAAGRRTILFPRDGRIDVEALLAGFERGARAGGCTFELGVEVESLIGGPGEVEGARLADGREIRAEHTVIAAGGWAERLAARAGSRVRFRPTRRHLLVTAPDASPEAAIDPRWPVVWADSDGFYARPESGGMLLCACDEVDVDPDALAEVPEERERILAKAARWLPAFARRRPKVARFWSGVRTLTPDGRFVLGPDADLPGLSWAAGLGGQGVSCSPAVGEIVSAHIVEEPLADPAVAACSPRRFAPDAAPRS